MFASTSWSRAMSVTATATTGGQKVTATPVAHTYSSLLYVEAEDMFAPVLGPQTVNGTWGEGADDDFLTSDELAWAQNTVWWAPSKKYAPYYNPAKKGIDDNNLKYKNPANFYTSPVLYTATLQGLQCGAEYTYVINLPGSPASEPFTFTMPQPAAAAGKTYTFALVGDLGQTPVSDRSVTEIANLNPDVVLMAGDLSYADGWGWRWDSYGRMVQRLAAKVPVMSTVGNHEVVGSEQFVHYNARYPMPAESSKSPSNTYWSMDMYGVHVVTLNSYAALKKGSTQQQWLWQDLQNVDRTVTPWIIVMMHVPLYNSNEKHWGEQYFLLHQLEDVLYHAGVDLVISGHVHAYERNYPAYKQAKNSCGPVYLTVGDAGNRGGTDPWVQPQPDYSAFRESSFGVGGLTVHNSTHAQFTWTRHACQVTEGSPWGDTPGTFQDNKNAGANYDFDAACVPVGDLATGANTTISDSAWIVRDTTTCANRLPSALKNLTAPPEPYPTPAPPAFDTGVPPEPWLTQPPTPAPPTLPTAPPTPTPPTPTSTPTPAPRMPTPTPTSTPTPASVPPQSDNSEHDEALGIGLGLGLGLPAVALIFVMRKRHMALQPSDHEFASGLMEESGYEPPSSDVPGMSRDASMQSAYNQL